MRRTFLLSVVVVVVCKCLLLANCSASLRCTKLTPCADRSCCSKWGYCGIGSQFCGEGCLSNCEHEGYEAPVTECSADRLCPDNLCCSKFGYCGVGKDFCGRGCQSNCDRTKAAADYQPTNTECSRDRLCPDDACCSKWGFCGITEQHCGEDCLSNCDRAKAAAGAKAPGQSPTSECGKDRPCPDASCCSKWGFCGTTEEHCGEGCQSNCIRAEDGKSIEKTTTTTSCSRTKPCHDGSCCSRHGVCGHGEEFCGAGCQSNCAAKIECGRDAAPGRRTCPLNICCSQYGYCGISDEFCRSGCQSNCAKPATPQCPLTGDHLSSIRRVVGYYAGWALDSETRPCGSVAPEDINPEAYTHIILSFATIEENKLKISERDMEIGHRLMALKYRNPKLKIMLAVGGWAFNDEPTNKVFTRMTGSVENRRIFAASTVQVLELHGFDGLDVDWEYPVAEERGGESQDKTNYVLLLRELKQHFAGRFELSVAAPASYWYLRHFDLPEIAEIVDFINIMTYDMHGVWDMVRAPFVNAHTNLTEIGDGIEMYLRAGVKPEKLNLGLAFYARTFQLASSGCTEPGCTFIGPAKPGKCTNNPGTLSYYELAELFQKSPRSLRPYLDMPSASKILVWDNDQWVGYDDAETLRMKIDYAKSQCFGGIMIWSIDQDDEKQTLQNVVKPYAIRATSTSKSANWIHATDANNYQQQPASRPGRPGMPYPWKRTSKFLKTFLASN